MNDIMDALAAARPQSLDPAGPSAERRYRDLEAALSQPVEHARRRSPKRRLIAGLSGVVAVGAAATVAIVATDPGGTPRPHKNTSPSATTLDARQILLAAADSAAKEPVGRYWRVHTNDGQTYHTGPADSGYNVVGYTSESDRWTARSQTDPDMLYMRDLGAHPLTDQDKAAWKRAGSPRTWRVWSNDHYATLSATPGETFGVFPAGWQSEATTPAQKKQLIEQAKARTCVPSAAWKCKLQTMTWDEQAKAYSDPEFLKQMLFPPHPGGPSGMGPDHQALNMLTFLTESPAPPQARAEAYKLLAGVPGIRAIGKVQDVVGRSGIGLATRAVMQEGSGTVFDLEIVLDPQTYKVLAWERVVVQPGGSTMGMKPGTILSYQTYDSVGWTNDTPHHD